MLRAIFSIATNFHLSGFQRVVDRFNLEFTSGIFVRTVVVSIAGHYFD